MGNKKFLEGKHIIALLIIALIASGYAGLRKYYMDELTLSGVRISAINTGTLNNSDTTVPNSQVVYNAIQAAVISPGSGDPTGWFNILAYGGISNGGFSTGTDNSPALNAAIAAAPNNSVIYIPPGSFRFLETITWPTEKRVYLECYGDLFFGLDTAFIIDGNFQRLHFYSGVFGKNVLGSTVDYTGMTNPGIYLRNAKNCEVVTNIVSGFKYAIKCGGYSGGNQYNKVYYQRLWINSVGIELCAEGPNTTSRWSNDNSFYGGQITADTGIVGRKDASPGDVLNGNKFFATGFEYAGGANIPMKVALFANYAVNWTFFGGRIEGAGVTTKFLCTDVSGFQFLGWLMSDSWLNNLGYNAYVCGTIYGATGEPIATEAYGYAYSATNTYQNGRFRLTGTRYLFSASMALASNIDIDWDIDVDAFNTGATYTVPPGIKLIKINYTGGTNTTTLPAAAGRANTTVTVKNQHPSNLVMVSGAATGSITSIPGYGSVVYYSDGNQWIDVANNFASGGGGGSSQWIDDGSNIRYPNRVAIGRTGATASLHLGYRNTPSVANSGQLKIDAGQLLNAPENGSVENDGSAFWITPGSGIRQKVLTPENITTIPIPTGAIAVINDANYTVAAAVSVVVYSASTGTKVLTIPAASASADRELTIVNNGGSSISIPVGYYLVTASPTTTLAAGARVRLKSDGASKWWAIN